MLSSRARIVFALALWLACGQVQAVAPSQESAHPTFLSPHFKPIALTQGLVYAAMLTPQGKYLADFFLLRDGDAILLDVDAAMAPALLQRLTMYKLRADVSIAETGRKVRRGTGQRGDTPGARRAARRVPAGTHVPRHRGRG